MASENWQTTDALALLDGLEDTPWRYDFFQALRLIQAANVEQPRIGTSMRAAQDSVRLSQNPSLSFPSSTLASYRPSMARHDRLGDDADEIDDGTMGGSDPTRAGSHLIGELSVNFLGLFGPHGPLPIHLTEHVLDRIRFHDDDTFSKFADVFHHRMLSHFFRSWAQAQPTVSRDRPNDDRFELYLGALFGLGLSTSRNADTVEDVAKFHYCGQFANGTRHPEGLTSILSGYFELPFFLQEFIGEWMVLPEDGRFSLGRDRNTTILGENAIVGERVWSTQGRFRLKAGPMSLVDFERFLPGQISLDRVRSVVRLYCDDTFTWELNLSLRKDEVPETRLGVYGNLGWNTWLANTTRERANDADDLVLEPMNAAAVAAANVRLLHSTPGAH